MLRPRRGRGTAERNVRVIFDLFPGLCQVCNGESAEEDEWGKPERQSAHRQERGIGERKREASVKEEEGESWREGGWEVEQPAVSQSESQWSMCGTVSVYIELSVYVLTVSCVYLWRNSLFLLAWCAASSRNTLPTYPDCSVNSIYKENLSLYESFPSVSLRFYYNSLKEFGQGGCQLGCWGYVTCHITAGAMFFN